MRKKPTQLDKWILDFRKWAERVIYHVGQKYPKATIDMRTMMQLYAAGVGVMIAVRHFIQKYSLKGGI